MFVSRKLSTIDAVLSTATHFLLKRYKDSGIDFLKTIRRKIKGAWYCDQL